MKISKLVTDLEEFKRVYGDIPVAVFVPNKRKLSVDSLKNLEIFYEDEEHKKPHCLVLSN